MERVFYGTNSNRSIESNATSWAEAWEGHLLKIRTDYGDPLCRQYVDAYETATFWIFRSYLFFDTTVLSPSLNILAATLSLFLLFVEYPGGDLYQNIQVTEGVQHDPIVTGDWSPQNPLSTVGGQLDMRDYTSQKHYDISLNASGIGWINKSGITKFCIRQEIDVENKDPNLIVRKTWFNSAQRGAGYKPILTVYEPGSPRSQAVLIG